MNIKAFILLLLLIMFASCQKKQDNFLEDMASLDKAYMDTLLIIRDVNNNDRKVAIEKFIIVWNDFKKKYYNINTEDPQWKTDFDSLQDILIRSHYYISSKEDESAGYSILHDIKYVLSDLRKRNNVNWFFDNLNSIYKIAYRMGELSKIYNTSNTVLTQEEEEKLIVVYYLLDEATKTTIAEFDKSNIHLLHLSQQQLGTLKHNIETIDDLVKSIGNDLFSKKYNNISNISESILNIYFNSLQIIRG
ncbi:hypothetical protein [Brachyspira sp. G79]|uniref:hypothetical protein n=1 Tax=Brachyspira sp. G79 TaxID=1358104 RepID=UPI000BBBBDAA|nr:hypothetical protein [Brachyspira sp. G79]PCG19422.1 hypothetical protein KQ44_04790 [Brachyspira sp. G79]